MRIKTSGIPCHTPISLVKRAVRFYGEYLMGENLSSKVWVKVRFRSFKKGSDEYGYCDWEYDNHKARDFVITLDRKLSQRETLQALAHEMVHVKQYARGELKDLFRPVHMIKWKGEKYKFEDIDYWEQPWEIRSEEHTSELQSH